MQNQGELNFLSAPDKRGFIRNMFDSFAGRYDFFNRVASLFLESRWRKTLNNAIRSNTRILDVCTGTGTQVFSMSVKTEGKCKIVGIDFSENMLSVARKKLQSRRYRLFEDSIEFKQASAEQLPFHDHAFDTVCTEFAMRNVVDIAEAVVAEMLRVVKPGGQVLILELTRPRYKILRFLHAGYLYLLLPLWGKLILREKRGTRYLRDSVNSFYSAEDFVALMKRIGFKEVRADSLSGGIATLFTGRKG